MTTQRSLTGSPLAMTALPFLAGALLGTALGYFSGTAAAQPFLPGEEAAGNPVAVFLIAYSLSAIFSATAFLFGTSVIGRKIIPFFALLRGLVLSCSAACLLCAGVDRGEALLRIGIPAFFSVPAFFLMAEDGILSSGIICLCSGSGLIRSCDSVNLPRVAATAALLAAGVAAQQFLIPLIT